MTITVAMRVDLSKKGKSVAKRMKMKMQRSYKKRQLQTSERDTECVREKEKKIRHIQYEITKAVLTLAENEGSHHSEVDGEKKFSRPFEKRENNVLNCSFIRMISDELHGAVMESN